MGLTYALNELLACVVTGLSTAIFMGVLAHFGWLPVVYITTVPPKEEQDQGE